MERLQNFRLYTPRQDLTNFLVRYEIFKRVLEIQGSIVECGVLRGGGLMAWAQFSAIFEPTNHQRRVVGFDTFSGFPKLSKQDRASESEQARPGGLAVDSYDHLQRCIELFDRNRFVGHVPKVELVRGDATEDDPAVLEGKSSAYSQPLVPGFRHLRTDARGAETFCSPHAKGGCDRVRRA